MSGAMNEIVEPYRFTVEARRLISNHEAAHAFMAALGGINIYKIAIAVALRGAIEWAIFNCK